MSTFVKSKKFIGVVYKILKDKDRSYYITYKINDKFKRIKIGKKSEGVTEAFCHQKRNEAINLAKFGEDDRIVKTKKKVIPFDEIAQRFLEFNKIHAKDYTNHQSRYNNHIKSYLANKSIFDISYDDILQIQQDKKEKLAPKTINHIIQLISTIFNYNIKNKYISIENPVSDVKKLNVNNERLRYLSNEEVQKLYEVVEEDEQLLLFVKLALQTGGRMSTLINIKKQDIDLENRIISLQDFKNNSCYRGFFNNDVYELLEDRLKGLKANEQILLYNTQASNLQTYITKKMELKENILG